MSVSFLASSGGNGNGFGNVQLFYSRNGGGIFIPGPGALLTGQPQLISLPVPTRANNEPITSPATGGRLVQAAARLEVRDPPKNAPNEDAIEPLVDACERLAKLCGVYHAFLHSLLRDSVKDRVYSLLCSLEMMPGIRDVFDRKLVLPVG